MSTLFRHGHATHPDWRMATELAFAQIDGQASDARYCRQPTLGFVYVTSAFADALGEIAALLRERSGVADWVGTVGHAICATGAEYASEPAISILLGEFAAGSTRVFSGRRRPPGAAEQSASGAVAAHTALVHADPHTTDLAELIVDMASKTASGSVFGGIASGASDALPQLAGDLVSGGLSGAMFGADVPMLTRVTQGCSALAAEHTISDCDAQFIQSLDGRPALDVLLADLGVDEPARTSRDGDTILRAMPAQRLRSGLLVGLAPSGHGAPRVGFGDYLVRNVVGIDPQHRVVAVAGEPHKGDRAVFCTRDAQAARRDLMRMCTELREEIETRGAAVRGALYVSCTARGANLFGASSVELQLIESQLGSVPLTGFYANGEISGDRLFGYTGVLTLFL